MVQHDHVIYIYIVYELCGRIYLRFVGGVWDGDFVIVLDFMSFYFKMARKCVICFQKLCSWVFRNAEEKTR